MYCHKFIYLTVLCCQGPLNKGQSALNPSINSPSTAIFLRTVKRVATKELIDASLQLIISSLYVGKKPAVFPAHINLWSPFQWSDLCDKGKVLSTTQLVSDEKVETSVMPITDSNCHVMKLMFCRIYNLILMVFPFYPLSSSYSVFPHFCYNNGDKTIREGSLILFSFDFFLLLTSLLLKVKQEPAH